MRIRFVPRQQIATYQSYELKKAVQAAAENEDVLFKSKRQYYIDVMDALIQAGCPRHEIPKTGRRLIEAKMAEMQPAELKAAGPPKINTTHWYRVMVEHGCSIHANDEEEDSPDGNNDDSYIREENAAIIKVLSEYRQMTGDLIDAAKGWDDPIIADEKTRQLFIEDLELTAREAIAAISGRPKIAENTHHIWKACHAAQNGLRRISIAYMHARTAIIEQSSEKYIDSKQANKYQRGMEPMMMEAYKPRNRYDALYRGYLGIRCPECGSYRASNRAGKDDRDAKCEDCEHVFASGIATHHMACGAIITKQQASAMFDGLRKDKEAKCPDCGEPMELPPYLEQYCK